MKLNMCGCPQLHVQYAILWPCHLTTATPGCMAAFSYSVIQIRTDGQLGQVPDETDSLAALSK